MANASEEKSVFSIISLLFSLGKEHGLLCEQSYISVIQGYFVPSLVEIDSVVLVKKIFKNLVNVFSLYCCNLPFYKGLVRSFKKKLIPFTQGCFVPILMKLAQWFYRNSQKYEKVTTIKKKSNDVNVHILIREANSWAFDSGEK